MTDNEKAALILHRIHIETGITPQLIFGKKRQDPIVRARHLAYYAIWKTNPEWGTTKIAKALRGKHRGSTVYAVDMTLKRMMYEPEYKELVGRVLA